MINQFKLLPLIIVLVLNCKTGDMVPSYLFVTIMYTSIISPVSLLYFNMTRSKCSSLSLYGSHRPLYKTTEGIGFYASATVEKRCIL